MTGRVKFTMSEELLVQQLLMPEDTEIVAVRVVPFQMAPIIEFEVIHENLPTIPNHIPTPEVIPGVTREGYCTNCGQYETHRWHWNYKKDKDA